MKSVEAVFSSLCKHPKLCFSIIFIICSKFFINSPNKKKHMQTHSCLSFSQLTEWLCLHILFPGAGKAANIEWQEQIYEKVKTKIVPFIYLFIYLPFPIFEICLHIVYMICDIWLNCLHWLYYASTPTSNLKAHHTKLHVKLSNVNLVSRRKYKYKNDACRQCLMGELKIGDHFIP